MSLNTIDVISPLVLSTVIYLFSTSSGIVLILKQTFKNQTSVRCDDDGVSRCGEAEAHRKCHQKTEVDNNTGPDTRTNHGESVG